jgi:hypothetical protein
MRFAEARCSESAPSPRGGLVGRVLLGRVLVHGMRKLGVDRATWILRLMCHWEGEAGRRLKTRVWHVLLVVGSVLKVGGIRKPLLC